MSRGKQRERPLPGKRGHGIMNENQTERGRAMKITARAIKRGAAGLLLGAALVLLWDWTAHPIELNMVTLPEQIAAFHNRESEDWDPSEITVYGGVSVGDREYCLMEIGEYLGSVTLERGLTGRYKIEYLRYGDGGFRDAIVESGGGL